MEYRILGQLEVLARSGPVALGGRLQRTVLARLILDAGRPVSSDQLVEDVWAGRPPETAAKSVQKYVSELRRLLGPGAIRTTSGGYVLDAAENDVDARRFERLVGDSAFEAALGLWRDELLADLDPPFVLPERARLAELRLLALEGRLAVAVESGRAAEAVAELTDLVGEHPLRERLVGLLALALYRSGRQVEALRALDRHRRRLAEDIGVEPAAELRELEAAILRHDIGPGGRQPQGQTSGATNVPLQLSSLVGRTHDIAAVIEAVTTERLVTLTGPGGIGKTRLALEAARLLSSQLAGGAWLVDLAAARSDDLVADTVAGALALDVREAASALAAITSSLAHRPPTLLVLDNCEHLIDACRHVAATVLGACPDTRVLATSRVPLGVDGEYVRPMQPLPHEEAVELFVERARLAGADLSGAATGGDVSEICARTDGLPLAVELAASQLRVLTPAELATRLQDRLHFRARSAGSPRQRTLRDMVAWSEELLPRDTRQVFARLGVFASSLTLEAAEAVCATGPMGPAEVLDHVTTLVDHSLLVRESHRGGSRYRLLETLRLFALERLGAEAPDAHRRHADFYLRLAADAGPRLYGPDERAWRLRVEAEEPNIHVALTWAAAHDQALALRLAIALWPYWDVRWGERTAIAYLDDVLSTVGDGVPRDLLAWGYTVAADLAANPGEARRSKAWADQAVALFRRLGDERGLAHALAALSAAHGNEGRLDDAAAALTESVEIARRLGEVLLLARALNFESFIASRRGDHRRAAAVSREELATWSELGSRRGQATALRHLAVAHWYLGELDEAEELCHRALLLWEGLDDPTSVAHVRLTLGDIARARDDRPLATTEYESALADLRPVGDRRCTASSLKNLGLIAIDEGGLDRAADLLTEALRLRRELGDVAGLAECLEGLAVVRSLTGDHEGAVALVSLASATRAATGANPSPEDRARAAATAELARRHLPTDRFDAAVDRGRLVEVDDVLEQTPGYSEAWQTASTLFPSGSRTKAP
jgi:predicted ATPase/DNA-binding SARP family transcriptional activator